MAVKKIGEGTPFEPPIPQSQVQNLESDLSNKASVSHTHNQTEITDLDTTLANKASISHNHNLNDLSEKSYNSLTDKPTFANVATSGSYNDLSDTPNGGGAWDGVLFVSNDISVDNSTDYNTPRITFEQVFESGTYLISAYLYVDNDNQSSVGIQFRLAFTNVDNENVPVSINKRTGALSSIGFAGSSNTPIINSGSSGSYLIQIGTGNAFGNGEAITCEAVLEHSSSFRLFVSHAQASPVIGKPVTLRKGSYIKFKKIA